MNKKMKIVMSLSIITSIFIFISIRNKNQLKVPDYYNLQDISFIKIVEELSIEKITFYKKAEVKDILEILASSKRVKNKRSSSDFPDRTAFTIVTFNFSSSNDNSWCSFYEENNNLYIEQPYVGVYKLNSTNFKKLKKIIKQGYKRDISMSL